MAGWRDVSDSVQTVALTAALDEKERKLASCLLSTKLFWRPELEKTRTLYVKGSILG